MNLIKIVALKIRKPSPSLKGTNTLYFCCYPMIGIFFSGALRALSFCGLNSKFKYGILIYARNTFNMIPNKIQV